ncbi:hypothetical protein O3P69_011115 [Scylla paramamosain]|uniref:Ig-like domain-containing protein n=1 Tax=Scylla paramamosain TaxID=85552 RepID=A0AAW0SUC5_SCYPA
MLERVGLDSAGVYKCEVMADTSFQTEFREANMTVIYVPDGPPTIAPALGTHSHNITVGQRVTLRCSSRPANPPPLLTWLINGRHVNSSWVSVESPVFQRDLARVSSKLTFPVTPDLVVGGRGVEVTCIATQATREGHTTPLRASFPLHPSSPMSFWENFQQWFLPPPPPLPPSPAAPACRPAVSAVSPPLLKGLYSPLSSSKLPMRSPIA